MELRFPVWRLHGGGCGPAFSSSRAHQLRASLGSASPSVGPHVTSSFVILGMEAIYGYVSGTAPEGARGKRGAEGKRRTGRKREWRENWEMKGHEQGRGTGWEVRRGKRERGNMKRTIEARKGKRVEMREGKE